MSRRAREFLWCGVTADFQNGLKIHTNGGSYQAIYSASVDDIRPVLLNESLMCPQVFYKLVIGAGRGDDKRKWKRWRHDLLLLSLGVAGVEYIKTMGWRYMKNGYPVPAVIETVLGSVTVLLQKPASCFKIKGILNEELLFCAEEFIAIKVPQRRKIVIPPGYDIVIVNNSLNPAAVSIAVEEEAETVPSDFLESKGAAYYVIKKNARQELVPNPRYKILPPLKKKKAEEVWEKVFSETMDELLYQFVVSNVELLDRLYEIDWNNFFS